MIWLKIFGVFMFWFVFYFMIVLSAALFSGAPTSDTDKVMKSAVLVSFIPIILVGVYKVIKFYFFNAGQMFSMTDLYWYVVPTLVLAFFVYSSK